MIGKRDPRLRTPMVRNDLVSNRGAKGARVEQGGKEIELALLGQFSTQVYDSGIYLRPFYSTYQKLLKIC